MPYLADRVLHWLTYEPLVAVMMVVATLVLFVGAYRRRGADQADRLWPWTRRVLEAAATAVVFLALLWGFRAILGDNARTFRSEHGRVTAANYGSVQSIWGEPHVQRELRVTMLDENDEYIRADPIAAFRGEIVMRLNERQKGSALYNGFEADLALRYRIVNPSRQTAETIFALPLSSQRLVDDLHVRIDGRELEELELVGDGVSWRMRLGPQQRVDVEVHYRTRGMEYLYYQVPERRQIRDFRLEIFAEGIERRQVNYPELCLTPQSIETTEGGVRLVWSLDRAVTTAGMGLALPTPEQPGAKVALVLDRSPFALMLLVVAVSLTLMVRGESVSFVDLALLCAAYCVVFLTMAAVTDYAPGFWGALGLGAAITCGLSWTLWRRHPARVPICVLLVFFVTVFPLAGLVPEHRTAFDSGVAVALIVYLFALALARRHPAPLRVPVGEHELTPPG